MSWPRARLDFVNSITIFGAAMLWSALPLIILLSSLANTRIDDDLSRHVGLNSRGAHIVATLFRGTPAHGVEAIVTGFLFCFGGVVAVASSLQLIYERIFGQEPRGWRNLPRGIVWIVAVLGLLAFDGVTNHSERAAGPGVLDLVGLATTTLFFWWTLHFLLRARVTAKASRGAWPPPEPRPSDASATTATDQTGIASSGQKWWRWLVCDAKGCW